MTDAHDDAVLGRISRAFDDLGPVPGPLADAARSAFGWRRADAALAELLFDSAHDELAGVRGASDRRSFRFGHGDVVVRVHLTDASMIVMIEPPVSVTCTVETERGRDEYRTDEYGELAIEAPELPARLMLEFDDGTVVTPWITG